MLDRMVGSAYEGQNQPLTVIHRGVYPGTDPGLQCYTMISELEPPHAKLLELAKKAGMTMDRVSKPGSVAGHLGVD
jgi:hypothetical protein